MTSAASGKPQCRRSRKCQRACKPGFVHRVETSSGAGWAIIPLGPGSRPASSNQPGRPGGVAHMPSLFDLAPGGVYHAVPVAGTAVRSYRTLSALPGARPRELGGPPGGLLSVALSLGSPPPGVTRHRYSLEPGLSSPHRINGTRRSPGPLAAPYYVGSCRGSSSASPSRWSSSRSRIARVSPSAMPSMVSGRKRRWKAVTAAGPSPTS